ncbi:MAG: phenylalanine--tRNA ligase subunit alpha [Candidatus Paraimprobicoccus trichonymphae]|uniref:Phenylalanine--tRNA ligase alpha subunit n=1 Tax=Candidatus Paraimprobicoccus trichonymphae TaxID=3033793 RepID=A0AA48KXS2_9FIRM|nr:MAG: phenylalanine--tRNA ligase subunit alpha [Candidatus Paraimprobicoccus trichonymphae]
MNIKNFIEQKKQEFLENFNKISNFQEIKDLNFKYLNKNLKILYFELKNITSNKEKKEVGKLINEFKIFLEQNILKLKKDFSDKIYFENYDISIFKNNINIGVLHPLTKLYKKMENIFISMGFSVTQGLEIELDKYNFEKLNIPKYHPARDMQDTFYILSPNILLRSHTSSVQIRAMENKIPPINIISPGTVYRVDDIDPQHTPMFYQVEGLMVGEDISFANLKAVLINLLKNIFGDEIEIRFRPSYYPYTEPSAAIDMSCAKCNKKGCRICNYSGWITVLGSGMVHPNVLKSVGYNSEKYIGFAFGLGLNRLALLYYNLGNIKKIYENDINLWRQL